MAYQLAQMGVPYEYVYIEGYSDDTLGNAFFVRGPDLLATHLSVLHQATCVVHHRSPHLFLLQARTMHVDSRADWRRLGIITSDFQMARTRAIYDWIFSLTPLPAGKELYKLFSLAVDDTGALPEAALQARRRKEAGSLAGLLKGQLLKHTTLQAVHTWIFTMHSAYAPAGVLQKKVMNDSATAASY